MPLISYKTVASLAGAVGSIVYHERNAPAYMPTFSSIAPAAWKVGSTAMPAFVLGIHEETPTEGYKQENRELLTGTIPHVKSVNDRLEKENVGLSHEMAYNILKQDEAKPIHGSGEDFAHEEVIGKGFFSEFELNISQGKHLAEQGASPKDFAKIKHEATYNLVGAFAHASFAAIKSVGHGLATTPSLNKAELHDKSEKKHAEHEKHSTQLNEAKKKIETYKEVLTTQRAKVKKEKTDSNVEKKDLPEKKNNPSL